MCRNEINLSNICVKTKQADSSNNIFLDDVVKWLNKRRWWPKSNYVNSIDFEVFSEYIFLWITDNLGGKYFVPLKKIFLENQKNINTSFLISCGCVYVEADLIEPFLLKMNNFVECENLNFISSDCVFDRVELLADSSNVVTILSSSLNKCKVVSKSYRIVFKDRIESKILRYLSTTGFKYIPKVYAICSYKGYDIGLVMDYVEGVDGGAPFYRNLVDFLKKSRKEWCIELGYKVGYTVAELHKIFALASNDFLKAEVIVEEDVNKWIKQLDEMTKNLLQKLDMLHSRSLLDGFWIEIVDKKIFVWIEKASAMFLNMIGLVKIMCHRDLHLGQMVYTKNNEFVITDFEGEPVAIDREPYAKFHGFRDIASLVRSLDYIFFSGAAEIYRVDVNTLARKFAANGWGNGKIWRDVNIMTIVNSYINTIEKNYLVDRVLGSGFSYEHIYNYLVPWYIYRVVYEALYESMYRPYNLPIPLHIFALDFEYVTKYDTR